MSVFATSALDCAVASIAPSASIGFAAERTATSPIPAVPARVHAATVLTYHGSNVLTARLTPKAASASPTDSGRKPVVRNATADRPGRRRPAGSRG